MLRVRNNDYVKMMYFLKDAVKKRIINELNVEKIVDNSNMNYNDIYKTLLTQVLETSEDKEKKDEI